MIYLLGKLQESEDNYNILLNFELKESIQKCKKNRPKVFWAIEKWTFLRLKNVHFWISEKSFKKIKNCIL